MEETGIKGKKAGKTQLFGQSACSGENEEGEHGKKEMMDWKPIFLSFFFGKNSNCCQALAGNHRRETPEIKEIKLILKLDLQQSYLCWCSEERGKQRLLSDEMEFHIAACSQ